MCHLLQPEHTAGTGVDSLVDHDYTGHVGTGSVARERSRHTPVTPAGKPHLVYPVGLHSVKLGKAASLQMSCLQRSWTADGQPLYEFCGLLMGLLSHHCGLWKQARGWGVACLGWGVPDVGCQWGSGQAWVHQAGLHLLVKCLLCQHACAILPKAL